MDELELLKKDWKKREASLPRLSYEEIYKMIWKRSSSNVKWIFIISVIEFTLGIALFFYSPSYMEEMEYPEMDYFLYITYPVLLYFIYRFYHNYKRISTTSSVRELMRSIIRARRTVKHYIIFNLIVIAITSITTFFLVYVEKAGGWETYNQSSHLSDHLILVSFAILITAIILGICLGVYLLLYGFLLRRLNRNYKELKQLEV
ncbi:hypothetical protein [Sinomicrobium weinanense]|uniref:Uncharacterized protein n=1 Tax=Sinomicrobium weinanense TaxID=2842200 RepID=A0A926JQS9_9FLAO|nr:hypothetical protein [Sinomicrobium weinanense]MBC9795546.1 hypothetical protein [Sinomicrobium weinanense]MBU3124567.1 hypothetical protein [Sinomicrobium weinanense]